MMDTIEPDPSTTRDPSDRRPLTTSAGGVPSAGVVVERLVKTFGSTTAVAGLSFRVAPGEIYGLLGPNGAGKTTTLRILAGILAPTAGEARVAGLDVAANALAVRRRLGFLTNTTGLYARLTGHELLTYFARLHGLTPEAGEARMATLVRALGLEPFFGRRCEALSTGERQRLSIARAVLHDPDVLILDEPTAGLDVLASRFLRDFVRAERDRGKAVLFSTHYLAEAELLCDRIGLLHRGRLLAEGTPAALRAAAGDAPSLEEAFLRLVAQEPGVAAEPADAADEAAALPRPPTAPP
jgi:sodium transport system ATP-binding protein